MIKSYNFRDVLKKKMQDPEFRKEWEANEEEFALACKVIEMRIKSGMTQAELAKKAHTSQPAIARLESGSYQNVSLSFLRKIGKVFGVEPHISFKKVKTSH